MVLFALGWVWLSVVVAVLVGRTIRLSAQAPSR